MRPNKFTVDQIIKIIAEAEHCPRKSEIFWGPLCLVTPLPLWQENTVLTLTPYTASDKSTRVFPHQRIVGSKSLKKKT